MSVNPSSGNIVCNNLTVKNTLNTGSIISNESPTNSGGNAVAGTHLVDPTSNDDSSLGYDVGEFWLTTDPAALWLCIKNDVGNAYWIQIQFII